ncbi:MAG: hypothetical protein ABIL58_15495 [Pseudomonadota bacterium]
MKNFAVLQLAGCAGCEVSLLDADAWIGTHRLAYMPLVSSVQEIPAVDMLLVSGGVRTDEDRHRLRRAVLKAKTVIAVGTCAIAGGVASLGNRAAVRRHFAEHEERHHLPHLLPQNSPIDDFVTVDRYLPGCPPTPELFMAVLSGDETLHFGKTVCTECGRKKAKELRPARLEGFRESRVMPDICLIKQGFLCVGTSTRNGCGAPCTRAGFPCVGCRGPSDILIEKQSGAWFETMNKVFHALTDIPPDTVDAGLRSPQYALFLFQFSDADSPGAKAPRPKERIL